MNPSSNRKSRNGNPHLQQGAPDFYPNNPNIDLNRRARPRPYFYLKGAKFNDGSFLTARDVAFSLNLLKSKGHPTIRQTLRDLDAVEAEADDIVMVRLKPHHSREAALIIAGQPIFSAAYYKSHPFDETTLEPPLGRPL